LGVISAQLQSESSLESGEMAQSEPEREDASELGEKVKCDAHPLQIEAVDDAARPEIKGGEEAELKKLREGEKERLPRLAKGRTIKETAITILRIRFNHRAEIQTGEWRNPANRRLTQKGCRYRRGAYYENDHHINHRVPPQMQRASSNPSMESNGREKRNSGLETARTDGFRGTAPANGRGPKEEVTKVLNKETPNILKKEESDLKSTKRCPPEEMDTPAS